MTLPEPNLDDLRFQRDIVDVARRKISQYCPEWTDYNISDPGITLIELFAWMTEQMVWRLNRVPNKVRIQMLNMMGFQMKAATSARVPLTFRLTTSLPLSEEDETVAWVPVNTEVATRATEDSPEVVYSTEDGLMIVPPIITQLRKESVYNKNYLPRIAIDGYPVFGETRPKQGDTFYIGFDDQANLAGHIISLQFECEETQATGIRRSDPPWVWECSLGDDEWYELSPSTRTGEQDTTGGLNNTRGAITFYTPLGFKADVIHGKQAFWVRCRLEQRRREQGMYTATPKVISLKAVATGATTMASQSTVVQNEQIGHSDGNPGQVFFLENAPVLDLASHEKLKIEENQYGENVMVPWTRVETFAESSPFDRHFVLDTTSGQITFGPSIIQPDGSAKQYGRVPEPNRLIEIDSYRFGGGQVGNVPANRITELRTAVPYILEVVNLDRATGGRDSESLEEAMFRARREMRSQDRAVTAQDFEDLTLSASRMVARSKALAPHMENVKTPAGMVEVLVVPAVFDAVAERDYTRLNLQPKLVQTINRFLDQYRLLTSRISIRKPRYVGVKVDAEIIVAPLSDPDAVQARVIDTLYKYFSPLDVLDEHDRRFFPEDWAGWEFGNSVYQSAVFALLQQIPGVQNVLSIKIYSKSVDIGIELASSSEAEERAPDRLNGPKLLLDPDELVVSLGHLVTIAEL